MDNIKTRTNVYRFIIPLGKFLVDDYVLDDSCHNCLVVMSNGVRPTRYESGMELLGPDETGLRRHSPGYGTFLKLSYFGAVAMCKKEELKKLLPHLTKRVWRNWAVHVFKDDKTVVDFYNAKFKLS